MFMDNDVEGGNLGPYADRPRVFPSKRSKVHTPLIFQILMGINVRVLLILLLLGLGAIFYIGAKTSPIIVFVFSIGIISFLFSIYLTEWVLTKDEGPPEMFQSLFIQRSRGSRRTSVVCKEIWRTTPRFFLAGLPKIIDNCHINWNCGTLYASNDCQLGHI